MLRPKGGIQVWERGPFYWLEVVQKGTFSEKGYVKGVPFQEKICEMVPIFEFSMWNGADLSKFCMRKDKVFGPRAEYPPPPLPPGVIIRWCAGPYIHDM